MTLGTRVFWVVVVALLLAAALFASQVEARRARGVARAADARAAGSAP